LTLTTTAYRIEPIFSPENPNWEISQINNNRVMGHSTAVDAWISILWDGSERVLTLTGPNGTVSKPNSCVIAWGISSNGTIVGTWAERRNPGRGRSEGFVQKLDGSTTYLGSHFPLSSESQLFCINNSGVTAAGYDTLTGHAFTFDTTTGSVVDRGKPVGCDQAWPTSINNSGDIVGSARMPDGINHGLLLRNGVFIDLGVVDWVPRITDNGLIAGVNFSKEHVDWTAGIYDTSARHPAWQTIEGMTLHDVNESGIAVGTVGGSAAIWTAAGGVQDLNTLAPFSGWHLGDAKHIDTAGQIVGYGQLGGETRIFMATPYLKPIRFEPRTPDLLWPIWLELPQALSQLDPESQEVVRGLMLNHLGQKLTDHQARAAIKEASLNAVTRALERLRRAT